MGTAGRARIERDMSFEAFRSSLADFMKPLALAAALVQSL
jgi:hypothetical protein